MTKEKSVANTIFPISALGEAAATARANEE